MMHPQQQQPVEIQDTQKLSKEGQLVTDIFSEMRKKQPDFLDEPGKSINVGLFTSREKALPVKEKDQFLRG